MSNALATKKVAGIVLGFAVLASAFAFATPAKAQTSADLQAQIQSLLATIAQLQAQLNTSSGSGTCVKFTFTANLKVGSKGTEVMQLQKFLNQWAETRVSASGAGSPGNETSTFGPATKAAVIKFQEKYAADILTPNGLSKGTGNWSISTRAKANAIAAACVPGTTPPGQTPPPTTTGGNVVVSAGTQPANSLAPKGAARVPFTTFVLTNTSGAAVTINGVTVQRTGLAVDTVFSGVALVDSTNVQIGTSKTLNSNHQATVGDTFTLGAGQSVTLTVVGNMASSLTTQTGQIVGIQVVGINTSATVSGSLPINGAMHTINDSLSIGGVSTSTSAFDPGAAVTRNIGDMGVRFSGIRFTATSVEDLKLYSIRWRQVGSAASSDLANVVTIVNGTSYPTTVDSTGKYYTTVFPGGITITKGNSIDSYIQGDIVGTNASSRTVDFDIDKVTDVYFVGQLYGYGIAPSGTYQPWYNGYVTTIAGATATTISKANEIPAQNISSNTSNVPLGGYATNFSGEGVSVQQQVFYISYGTTAATGNLLTSVSLVNENGVVVAGPVDAAAVGGTQQKVTFTDTVTYSTGRHVYTLKGKIPSTVSNNDTLTASTTPSSDWTNITGATSGNSVSLTAFSSAVTMNQMTIKGPAVTITVGTSPTSGNITSGVTNFTFATINLDATQSGDDVRLASLPVSYSSNASNNLTACQIYDNSNLNNPLNTGSRVLNSLTHGSSTVVSFDNLFIVPKGTIKTLAIKCNLSTSASSSSYYQFGTITDSGTNYSITSGAGATVSPTVTATGGPKMTVAAASMTLSVDASSPSYQIASGGQMGVTLGVIKVRATNSDLSLTRVGLVLTGSASSSAADLQNGIVNLYSPSGTMIGTAQFGSGQTTATSTLSTPISISADTDYRITVKGDIADVGTNKPATEGHLLKVDPLNGQALAAGSTVNSAVATAAVAGVRIFNTFPTLALGSLPGTGMADGRLIRFTVKADAADSLGIWKFAFTIATSTSGTGVTSVALYGYDQNGQPISGQGTSGQIGSTTCSSGCSSNSPTLTFFPTTNQVTVPAGQTYTFELRAAVTSGGTGASVVTTILGDSAYPSLASGVFTSDTGTLGGGSNFLWSPNSTTTAAITGDNDWTNSYGVAGFPSNGLIQARGN